MIRKRKQPMKKCPRCHIAVPEQADTCPDCSLSFDRLKIATNKDAKRKLLRNDREFIIRTSVLPSDIKRYKLLLVTIFLGFFGGHCFYVGRYLKGSIYLLNFLLAFFCVVFNNKVLAVWDGMLMEILGCIIGFFVLFWMLDIWLVIFKKFKVPIAIDLKEDGELK